MSGTGAPLPSLTTVIRKGRSNPKRGTASGLFDSPDMDPPNLNPLSPNSSPRHDSAAAGLLAEESSMNNTTIAEKVWGHLYSMKQQIKKYSAGKIRLDELQSRNQATLKRILKLVQHRRPTATSSPTPSPNSSLLNISTVNRSPSPSPTTSSALEVYSSNSIARLLYVLQLDQYVVYHLNS